jgi:hypothetical protein
VTHTADSTPPATATPRIVRPDDHADDHFRLGLIGDTRSGKTVYLTALSWLAQEGPMPPGTSMNPGDPESAQYLGVRVAMIRSGEWPPGTLDDNAITLFIDQPGRTFQVFTSDFRGGDFGQAAYGKNDRWGEFVGRWFGGCSAYAFLVDPGDLLGADHQTREQRTASITVALQTLRKQARGVRFFHRPVAVIFTKCDLYSEVAADPRKFAMTYMKQTCDYLARHSHWHQFFAVSSTGSVDGSDHPPRPLRPQGVYEPLLWCHDSHRSRGRGIRWIVAAILILLLALGYGWLYMTNARIIASMRRRLAESNPAQIHSLYGEAQNLGVAYAFTHPRDCSRLKQEILTFAERKLLDDLESRFDANRNLQTVQDFAAAKEDIHQFADRYPGTEPAGRWTDWLARQREVMANKVLEKLRELVHAGNETEFKKLRDGDYQKVAVPAVDKEITKLREWLNQNVVRARLNAMWAVVHPSDFDSIQTVRAECRKCEETLESHPMDASTREVEYITLVRRVFDDLKQNGTDEEVTLKIESRSNNPIWWFIKINTTVASKADSFTPVQNRGPNWYGHSVSFGIDLKDLGRPVKTHIKIAEDIIGPWNPTTIIDTTTTHDGDPIKDLIRDGQLTMPDGKYVLKCDDTGMPRGWQRLQRLLKDLTRMKELEDELFRNQK